MNQDRKDVNAQVGDINEILRYNECEFKLFVNYNGDKKQPRAHKLFADGTLRPLTPRLEYQRIIMWLNGFDWGLQVGLQIGKESQKGAKDGRKSTGTN
jgi:hypothetical protein